MTLKIKSDTKSLPVVQPSYTYQIASAALYPLRLGAYYLVYAPSKWLFDTVIYYLTSTPKTAPHNYSCEDLKILYHQETLPVLKQGYYTTETGRVSIADATKKAVDGTVKQNALFRQAEIPFQPKKPLQQIQCSVWNMDAVDAAIVLRNQGLNPVLLNPANAHHAGGGYLHGARAMEEDLCRRSGLSFAIDRLHGQQKTDFYPLKHSALLYTPNVPFFRSGHDKGYAFMPTPVEISVITSAAIDLNPNHDDSKYLQDEKEFIAETRRRIYAQLWCAAKQGHDCVVLTAFGCGAFLNKPELVAKIYQEVINTKFSGVFRNITFAIIDDHNAKKAHNPEGNFKPFHDLFMK